MTTRTASLAGLESMVAEADRMLADADRALAAGYPGAAARPAAGAHGLPGRRPATAPGCPRQWGWQALKSLETWAPGPAEFGAAMGLPDGLAADVRSQVLAKLVAEPIEDLRLDFEDGYGDRGDEAEDADARRAAVHLAGEIAAGTGAAVHRRARARAWRRPPAAGPSARCMSSSAPCWRTGRCRPGS